MKHTYLLKKRTNQFVICRTSMIALLIIIISFMRTQAQADPSKSITIHQEIAFKTSPQKLYEALLDSKQFSEFSGRAAEINPSVGGAFSIFKKHIVGQNIELIPNQRIVQAWRVADWSAGVYSIARFEFKSQGAGTLLVFDHIGFPEGLHDHLADGWQENYWDLLSKYFH